MNIVGRYLSNENIVVGLEVSDKKGALEAIALMVGRRCQINHAPIYRALWRREEIGSTVVGHGIAIPHARIAGIGEPIVLLVRVKVPINFVASDKQPVSILFVILVPEHANEEHLQILATASEMFTDKAFRDQLDTATEPAAIHVYSANGLGIVAESLGIDAGGGKFVAP